MSKNRIFAALTLALLTTGCATAPRGPMVIAMRCHRRVSRSQRLRTARRDLAVLAAHPKSPKLKRRPPDGVRWDRAMNRDRSGAQGVGSAQCTGRAGVTIAGGPRHDLGFAGIG